MQIPSDIADLLTKWVQERVTTMPDKDLQHLVPKFEQAGITKTKQLSAMSKQVSPIASHHRSLTARLKSNSRNAELADPRLCLR